MKGGGMWAANENTRVNPFHGVMRCTKQIMPVPA